MLPPKNPQIGQSYTDEYGHTWTWNGQAWTSSSNDAPISTTPSGPGGGTGVGPVATSSAPSYQDLYNAAINSPWYQQALASSQAADAADKAAGKANIQQMLIEFGLVPDGFKDTWGAADQTTRDLAAQNTKSGLSLSARLLEALDEGNRGANLRLAARGLRRSGSRGYALRKNQLGYDRNKTDAINRLLSSTNGIYNTYAQNSYGRQQGLYSALMSAINNMSSLGSGWGVKPVSTPINYGTPYTQPTPVANPGTPASIWQNSGFSRGSLGRWT